MAAEPVVLTCTLVTLASTTGSDLRQGKNLDPKKIVGAFLAMSTCAVLAEVDGEVGAGLAIAIAGTALVRFGIPALTAAGTPGTVVSTESGVVHTPKKLRPLPSPKQQAQQIRKQGYVTDNYSGSVGTVKRIN